MAEALPGKDLKASTCYYNNADLNDEDADEVAVPVTDQACDPDGGTLVPAAKKDGKPSLLQVIYGVMAPVIVSGVAANGCRDLIVPEERGNGWTVLKYGGKQYPAVEKGTSLANVDDQSGFAIFYNDIAADQGLKF